MSVVKQLQQLHAHMVEAENDEYRPIRRDLREELEEIMDVLGIPYAADRSSADWRDAHCRPSGAEA